MSFNTCVGLRIKEEIEKNGGMREYELWATLAILRSKKAAGFVGWVTCEMKGKESEWNKVTIMLAKYAEYANIGGNKTGGYGVTKFVSPNLRV